MKLMIELDREVDGRWIAEVPELNVLLYGNTKQDAIQRAPVGSAGNCSRPDRSRRVASRFGRCRIRHCRVSSWPSAKARRVFVALKRIGWRHDRTVGSHKIVKKDGWADHPFSFHDSEELGPAIPVKVSKKTGLQPRDL
jgi:predicted RNA binding protein YcfA (HicA-like mRNA interferase family)